MPARSWRHAALALPLALAVAVPLALAGTQSTQKVGGRLAATDDGGDAKGKFKFKTRVRGETVKEWMDVWAWRLDATKDDEGNLPTYELWLVNEEGDAEASFGKFRLSSWGRARFKFRSWRHDYPDDVDEVRDFSGGTVEVRLDDTVVLDGNIPDYIGLEDDNEEGSHSRCRAVGKTWLGPVAADGREKARLKTVYANKPAGAVQKIYMLAKRLEKGGKYTLYAVDKDGNETKIDTFRAVTRYGIGIIDMDTREGTRIPGGSVIDLGGQKAEVRDADEKAVLRGRFPKLL
jgi:hypothetical protein